jgi:hypothetical protein
MQSLSAPSALVLVVLLATISAGHAFSYMHLRASSFSRNSMSSTCDRKFTMPLIKSRTTFLAQAEPAITDVMNLLVTIQKNLEQNLTNVSNDLKAVSNEQKTMREEQKTMREAVGSINERLLRVEIAKMFGEEFARQYTVNGLQSLVQLIFSARASRKQKAEPSEAVFAAANLARILQEGNFAWSMLSTYFNKLQAEQGLDEGNEFDKVLFGFTTS